MDKRSLKSKGNGTKKILLRHPEQPLPKTTVIDKKNKLKTSESACSKLSEKSDKKYNSPVEESLAVPVLNSTLDIIRKIDKIQNMTIKETEKKPTTLTSEEITRRLNFPHYQQLYKDLVPVQVPPRQPQKLGRSSYKLLAKDPEPKLEDYLEDAVYDEYYYQPKIKRPEFLKHNDLIGLAISGILHKQLTDFS